MGNPAAELLGQTSTVCPKDLASRTCHLQTQANESEGTQERRFAMIAERFRSGFVRSPALQAVLLVSVILALLGAAARDVALGAVDEEHQSGGKNADAPALTDPAGRNEVQDTLCLMVESAARANDLPLEFLTHVIWQESHFRAEAVGPTTRSGQRARGIAQFMPDTARERGLLDPFNPVQALPKAAEFLAELRNQFGNLGFAAAAYNSGPRRVREWLAGTGGIPTETRNYVLSTTGRGLEDWVAIETTRYSTAKRRRLATNW
jgi:hypothetical protein